MLKINRKSLIADALLAIGLSSLLGSAIFASIGCYNTCDAITNPINQTIGMFLAALIISLLVGYTVALLYMWLTITIMNLSNFNSAIAITISGLLPVLLTALIVTFNDMHEVRFQFILGAVIYCGIATISYLIITRKNRCKADFKANISITH